MQPELEFLKYLYDKLPCLFLKLIIFILVQWLFFKKSYSASCFDSVQGQMQSQKKVSPLNVY